MNDQPSFWEIPSHGAARHTDPQTSKDAAKNTDATHLEGIFVDCLRRYGPCTGKDVAEHTGIALNSITPRMAPLRRKLLIEDSGQRKDRQIVWKLKE